MAKPRRSQGHQRADSFLTPFIPSAIGAEFVSLCKVRQHRGQAPTSLAGLARRGLYARTRKETLITDFPEPIPCSHANNLLSAQPPTLESKMSEPTGVAIRALP